MDDNSSSSGGSRHQGDSHEQQDSHGEQNDAGHSGEGAASALAHLKSQNKQNRHQIGEPGDAAGNTGGHGQ